MRSSAGNSVRMNVETHLDGLLGSWIWIRKSMHYISIQQVWRYMKRLLALMITIIDRYPERSGPNLGVSAYQTWVANAKKKGPSALKNNGTRVTVMHSEWNWVSGQDLNDKWVAFNVSNNLETIEKWNTTSAKEWRVFFQQKDCNLIYPQSVIDLYSYLQQWLTVMIWLWFQREILHNKYPMYSYAQKKLSVQRGTL